VGKDGGLTYRYNLVVPKKHVDAVLTFCTGRYGFTWRHEKHEMCFLTEEARAQVVTYLASLKGKNS